MNDGVDTIISEYNLLLKTIDKLEIDINKLNLELKEKEEIITLDKKYMNDCYENQNIISKVFFNNYYFIFLYNSYIYFFQKFLNFIFLNNYKFYFFQQF